MPGGGWLSADEADALLRCYGIPMVEFRRADDADAAVEVAAGLGGHVVLKANVPCLLHKCTGGAVELDLHGDGEVRAAMGRLQARFAGRLSGVLVEPMITGGLETIIGVVQEPVFGPVVVFGLGGVATDVLADHAVRLAPHRRRHRRPDPLHPRRPGPARAQRPPRRRHRRTPRRPAPGITARQRPAAGRRARPQPVIARPDGAIGVDARIR
jgi:hypothetical protein